MVKSNYQTFTYKYRKIDIQKKLADFKKAIIMVRNYFVKID